MQVTAKKTIPGFTPVQVTLTFETSDELGAFHSVFNHPPICHFVNRHGLSAENIRRAIRQVDGYAGYYSLYLDLERTLRR